MDPKSGFYDGTYLHGNSNLECIPEDLAVFGWSADSRVSLCSDSLHWAWNKAQNWLFFSFF